MNKIVFDNPRIMHGDRIVINHPMFISSFIGTAYYSERHTENGKKCGNVTYRAEKYFNYKYEEGNCHEIQERFVKKIPEPVVDEQYEGLYE